MKKTFYQLSLQSFLTRFACLFVCFTGVYAIIQAFIKLDIFIGLVGIYPIILSINEYINVFNNKIIFSDGVINITGNLGKESDIVQFPDKIKCSDIKNIRVIYVNLNSKKKSRSYHLGTLRPNLYFEFILKNDRTKWVLISMFSKKQRIEILNLINQNSDNVFVYDDLQQKDLSIFSKR